MTLFWGYAKISNMAIRDGWSFTDPVWDRFCDAVNKKSLSRDPQDPKSVPEQHPKNVQEQDPKSVEEQVPHNNEQEP